VQAQRFQFQARARHVLSWMALQTRQQVGEQSLQIKSLSLAVSISV
jgi:hypothetical protein